MNRISLKAQAKYVLKRHYLLLFIVSLVLAVLGGTAGVQMNKRHSSHGNWENHPQQVIQEIRESIQGSYWGNRASGYGGEILDHGFNTVSRFFDRIPFSRLFSFIMGAGIAVISFVLFIVIIGFAFLIAFPIQVGGARIFIDTSDGEATPNLGRLLYAFREGRFVNIAKAGFLKGLYTFLWSLLFIFPGVIKSYAYSMVPYILAENPRMKASDALRFSESITRGHKWELFVLDLSFIGWYILGSLLFGFGVFLVHPYKDATWAQAYLNLSGGGIAAYSKPVEVAPEGQPYSN